jgi:hypothetical protein
LRQTTKIPMPVAALCALWGRIRRRRRAGSQLCAWRRERSVPSRRDCSIDEAIIEARNVVRASFSPPAR